jgi:MFS family permease
VGPILGGLFTDYLSWRWCFFINLPLSAVSLVGTMIFLKPIAGSEGNLTFKERLGRLDYIGPVLFIPAMICLFLALQWGGTKYTWDSTTVIGLCVGFGMLMMVWIHSQYRQGEQATIPSRFLRQRTVFFASMYAFFLNAALIILVFYLPVYFQAVVGSSVTDSAINGLPLTLSFIVSAIAGGIAISKTGYFTPFMIVGTAAFTGGVFLLSTMDESTPMNACFGFQIMSGIGVGMNFQVPVLRSVSDSRMQIWQYKQSFHLTTCHLERH